MRIRQWTVVLIGALMAPPMLRAQNDAGSVSIRAVTVDGGPVSGALVALIAPDGQVAVERMTDDAGFRILTAPPGRYTVRIRRIGYEPFTSAPISLPYAGELKLTVSGTHISLETVVVTAGTQCKHAGVDQQAIGKLWEEISKALVGAQLTRTDFTNLGWIRVYKKEVGARGQIVKLDSSYKKVGELRPFGATDPQILAARGFVRGSLAAGWQYSAPDETVLLSKDFADTHCFRIVRDRKRGRQVGVSFEPSPERKIGEIAGVIWLDEQSAELRDIVFHFVNIGDVERFKPGGNVHFRRLASGAWIVDDWSMRFPILQVEVGSLERLVQAGYIENGGAIVQR